MIALCHPEFKFIELWWAARKAEVRSILSQEQYEGKVTQKLLKKVMKEQFDAAKSEKIQAMFRKTVAYMYIYAEGMDKDDIRELTKIREVRRSNRGVPETTLDMAVKRLAEKKRLKMKLLQAEKLARTRVRKQARIDSAII